MIFNIVLYLVILILKCYEKEMILWMNILNKKIALKSFKNLMSIYTILKE